jgi:hypothetical protein
MPSLDERKWNDIRAVYQSVLEDMKFQKTQQWLITYYSFGIYFAFSTLLFSKSKFLIFHPIIVWFVSIITLIVMFVGLFLTKLY